MSQLLVLLQQLGQPRTLVVVIFNARDILYNSDVIIYIVKLIVNSPVCKLILLAHFFLFIFFGGGGGGGEWGLISTLRTEIK